MEDIVAIKVIHGTGKKDFFLTWGRIFDPVDHVELLKIVSKNLKKYGISNIKKVSLLDSLKEVFKERYFFEGYFLMAQMKIPFGRGYKRWRKAMSKKISQGHEIYKISDYRPINKAFSRDVKFKNNNPQITKKTKVKIIYD